MSKLEVDAIEPQSGTTLTIGASGDSVNIASGATITDFTSTGIDDNATSTAITIDSSENVGIKTTSPKGDGLSIGTTDATAFISPGGSNNSLTLTTTGAGGVMRFYTQSGSDGNRATTESMRIDTSGNLKFNSGYGSVATAYGVRAWVHFDGSAGAVSINESSDNVSSVAEVLTGAYHVNLSPTFVDGNYSAGAFCDNDASGKLGSFVTVTATNYFRIELSNGFGGTALKASTEVHGHAVR